VAKVAIKKETDKFAEWEMGRLRDGETERRKDLMMGRRARWRKRDTEKKENPLQSVLSVSSAFHLFSFQKAVLLQNDSN
jgi:hypothetical protein